MQVVCNTLEAINIVHLPKFMNNDFCEEISKEFLKYKETHASYKNSNANCWRGQPHDSDSFDGELAAQLLEYINASSKVFLDMIVPPTNYTNFSVPNETTERGISSWVNINDFGGGNVIHNHTGSLMSGCMYFQSSGTGAIEFLTTNYLHKNLHNDDVYNCTSRYYPEDGDVLLFPGHLSHFVEPNPSNKQRINLAFNIF